MSFLKILKIYVIREIPIKKYDTLEVLDFNGKNVSIINIKNNIDDAYQYVNDNQDNLYVYVLKNEKVNHYYVLPNIYNTNKSLFKQPLILPYEINFGVKKNNLNGYEKISGLDTNLDIKYYYNSTKNKKYFDESFNEVTNINNAYYLAVILNDGDKENHNLRIQKGQFLFAPAKYLITLGRKPEIQDELTEALKKCLEAESFAPGPGRKYNASYNSNVSESFEPSWYL